MKETKVQQVQSVLSTLPAAKEVAKDKQKSLLDRLQSFKGASKRISDSVNDSLAIKELLPEISYIEQVLVSSILNPNDIGSDGAKIVVSNFTDSDKIDVALNIVENAIKEAFDFKAKMPTIISEALFTHGSYTILTLPNKMAMHMADLEKAKKKEKLPSERGDTAKNEDSLVALEHIMNDIKRSRMADVSISKTLSLSFNPSDIFLSDLNKVAATARERSICGFENILEIDSLDISTDSGKAIVKRLPTDSFIPIHAPGDNNKQIGGILLLDAESGMPVDTIREARYFDQLRASKNGSNDDYARMAASMGMRYSASDANFFETLRNTYMDVVDKEIRTQLENRGRVVDSIIKEGDILDALIARELRNKRIQMVYLPESVFTYFAFNIDQSGIGVSLIEKNKFFISLRVRLFIAEALAGIRNSTPLTKVSLTIDDEENEPNQITDLVLTEAINCMPDQLDDHSFNPIDIFASLKRASIMLDIDGGESMPGTKITMSDEQRNQVKPDTDIVERVYKQCCLGFGVPADIVDRALQGDFAAGIALSSAIFIRSVEMKQNTFDNDATEFYKKFIMASPSVYAELSKTLGEDKVDGFINGLHHQLPRADSTVYSEQNSVINDYKSLVTTVAEFYFTEDAFSGVGDELKVKSMLTAARTNFINSAMRDFIRSKNLLPEVSNIAGEEDIKALILSIGGANEDAVKFTQLLMETTMKMVDKANKETDAFKEKMAPPPLATETEQPTGTTEPEPPTEAPNFDEAAPPEPETSESDATEPPDADAGAPAEPEKPTSTSDDGEFAPPDDFEEEMEPPV